MRRNRHRQWFCAAAMAVGVAVCLLPGGDALGQGNRANVHIPANAHLTSQSPLAPKKPSFTDSISSTLKKGFDGLTAPLKSPPMPARSSNDPTSLSTKATPSVRLHVEVGRLAEETGKLDVAERHYLQALEMQPEDLHALLSYARLKDRQNKLDESFAMYQKAAELHPREAVTFNYLGLHYDRRGMSREAAASFARAVQLDPGEQLYRNNLAHVLVELDRLPEAFRHLRAVHGEAIAYYNLGYLLHKQDKHQAAMQHLQMALKKDPGLHQAQSLLAQLQPRGVPLSSPGRGYVQQRQPTRRPTFSPPQQPSSVAGPAYARPSGQVGSAARTGSQPVGPGSAYVSDADARRASRPAERQSQQQRGFQPRPTFQPPQQATLPKAYQPSTPREARRPADRPPVQRSMSRPPRPPASLRQPTGAVLPDASGYPQTSPRRYPTLGPAGPTSTGHGGPDYVAPPVSHRSSSESDPSTSKPPRAELSQPSGVVDRPDRTLGPVVPVSHEEPAE